MSAPAPRRETPLHDEADPLAEARIQLSVVTAQAPRAVAIVGAGLGYLTEAARERWPDAVLVVLEPLRDLAEAAKARTPALYAPGRVHVLVGPDYAGADALWKVFDAADAVSPSSGLSPSVVVHPVLAKAIAAPIAKALQVAQRAIDAATMNARAREENAGRYVCNTLRNVAHMAGGSDPGRLRDQFAGVPAIVVGAGPSLDAAIPALRGLDGRALLIVADTAWRPLAAAGIDPHIVVATDPTEANGRHLRGVTGARDTWVVAEGSVDPDALHGLRGRVGVFRIAGHHPWPWLNTLGIDRDVVKAWGSVLTSAFDLAVIAGCHPIVFVGADLSFTDGRPYCRGTSAEEDWAVHTARGASLRRVWTNTIEARPLRRVPDVTGGETPTAPHLIEFRNWLVAEAGRQPSGRVVNASGAGILMGAGITQSDLDTALAGCVERDAELRRKVGDLLAPRHDGSVVQRLVAALRMLEAQGDDGNVEPCIGEWLRFGRPRLTAADIRAAAAAGRIALESPAEPPTPTTQMGLRAPRWHAADRTALMHAQIFETDAGLDGTVSRPSGDADSRSRARADAVRAADALAALPHLAARLGGHVLSGALPHRVPLSTRFEWVEPAKPIVAVLEESLIELGVASSRSVVEPAPADEFWSGPIVPVEEPGRDTRRKKDTQVDIAARRAVFWERLAVDPCDDADDVTMRRRARLESAILRGLGHPWFATAPDDLLTLRYPASDRPMALPLRVDVLMRALTGTLARAVPGRESRRVLAADAVAHCEPLILTGSALPIGWSVATCGDGHAVFTPKASRSTVHVDADGRLTAGSSWPVPVMCEAPWGDEGGAVAWALPSTVLFRPRAGASVIRDDVPFTPRQFSIGPDGSAYFLEVTGELWDWVPGGTRRFVLFAPGAGFVRHEGTSVVLAPVTRSPKGVLMRRRSAFEWRTTGVPHEREEIAAAAEGQCNKVAPGVWTARSHPFSDLVRLERADGVAWLLACHEAHGVAWAGSSLAVTTQEGRLLLFPQLADRLDALHAGPRLAQPGEERRQ